MQLPRNLVGRIVAVLVGVSLGLAGAAAFGRTLTEKVATYHWRADSKSTIESYVRDHQLRKLQLGAGVNTLPGWLNTDIDPAEGTAFLDASKPFPIPDASFHYVFSEHVIEHLTYEDGLVMIRESFRVLEPGGKVRIVTPNLRRLIALFQDNKTEEQRNYLAGKLAWHRWPSSLSPEAMILNMEMRSFGHEFLYDPETLRDRLSQAGFSQIRQYDAGETDDPGMKGIELRTQGATAGMNHYEAMAFEAVRPKT